MSEKCTNQEVLSEEDNFAETECSCNQNDSIEEIMLNFVNIIDKNSISEITFDAKEFAKGVKDYSFVAGQITALVNCGLSPEMAMSYVLNKESVTLQKEMNVEMAKYGSLNKEKNEL